MPIGILSPQQKNESAPSASTHESSVVVSNPIFDADTPNSPQSRVSFSRDTNRRGSLSADLKAAFATVSEEDLVRKDPSSTRAAWGQYPDVVIRDDDLQSTATASSDSEIAFEASVRKQRARTRARTVLSAEVPNDEEEIKVDSAKEGESAGHEEEVIISDKRYSLLQITRGLIYPILRKHVFPFISLVTTTVVIAISKTFIPGLMSQLYDNAG